MPLRAAGFAHCTQHMSFLSQGQRKVREVWEGGDPKPAEGVLPQGQRPA